LASSYLALKVPTGELFLPPYVRSFPGRPDVRLTIDVISTLRRSYGTCLRCWSAYLGWRGLIGAAGQRVLEGREGKVTRWSKIANRARRMTILSKHQLLEHDK